VVLFQNFTQLTREIDGVLTIENPIKYKNSNTVKN